MKTVTIQSTFTSFESVSELPIDVQNAMQRAMEIRDKAYAPYSGFKVGASIQLKNGELLLGSNQENAAYPSGLCAERVAIYQAGALFPDTQINFLTLSACTAEDKTSKPISPCGACLQSILEYENKQQSPIAIYFTGKEGSIYKSDSVKNLLPLHFDKNFL